MAEKKLSQFRISNDTYDIYDKEAQDCLTDTNLINDSLNLNGNAIINGEFKIKPANNVTAFSVVGDGELQDTIYEETTYLVPFIFDENNECWVADLLRPLSDSGTDEQIIDFTWYSGSQKLNFTEGRYQENEWWEFTDRYERSFQLQIENRDQENNITSLSLYLGNNESELFPNGEPKVKIFGKFVQYKYDDSKIEATSDIFLDNANIYINSSVPGGSVYHRNADMDVGYDQQPPAQRACFFEVRDKNDQIASRFIGRQLATGEKRALIEANGFNSNGTSVQSLIGAQVDKQGNPGYYISHPLAFRNAFNWWNAIGNKNNNDIFKTISKSSVAVPTAGSTAYDYRNLCDPISLTPGYWMIFASVEFGTNSNGIRTILLNNAAAENSPSHIGVLFVDTRSANSGFSTRCKMQGILVVTETTSYYLKGYQNSGSSINVSSRIQAFRLV